jgi:phosphatidylglycerol---prolipoprotein diacylglyceryl transferase
MENAFAHDIDPIWFTIGDLNVRFYWVFAFLVPIFGQWLWTWQMRRAGYPTKMTWLALPWLLLWLFISIRLAHCLFYDPKYYLTRPFRFLEVWRGGFASHGAVVGAAFAFWTFARHYRMSFVETFDRFSFSAAAGATLVRIGNFLNSEIVGAETTLPWGVRFMRFDHGRVVRHPSQLYEVALGLTVLAVLLWADRRFGKEQRPRGLLISLAFGVYFTGRFFVEFVKEYQAFAPDFSPLTMGQYLSILPALIGWWGVHRALTRGFAQTARTNS